MPTEWRLVAVGIQDLCLQNTPAKLARGQADEICDMMREEHAGLELLLRSGGGASAVVALATVSSTFTMVKTVLATNVHIHGSS